MDMDQQEMDVDAGSSQGTPQKNGGASVMESMSMCSSVPPNYPTLPSASTDDWQYVMRRTMQEIIPSLYLGPYAAATKSKLQELKEAGITHIVCVRESRERNLIRPNHPDDFTYLVVELEDSSMVNIIPHFRTVNPFITSALSKGGKVLVHGSAGISRSVALVIAYIMETYGVTTQDAHRYVQSIRFCSNPNEGFINQLREYEPIYRAMHVVPLPLPNTQPASIKRSLDEDEDYHDNCKKGAFVYPYVLSPGNDSVLSILERKKTGFLTAVNLKFRGDRSPEKCHFLYNFGLRPKTHPLLEVLYLFRDIQADASNN